MCHFHNQIKATLDAELHELFNIQQAMNADRIYDGEHALRAEITVKTDIAACLISASVAHRDAEMVYGQLPALAKAIWRSVLDGVPLENAILEWVVFTDIQLSPTGTEGFGRVTNMQPVRLFRKAKSVLCNKNQVTEVRILDESIAAAWDQILVIEHEQNMLAAKGMSGSSQHRDRELICCQSIITTANRAFVDMGLKF